MPNWLHPWCFECCLVSTPCNILSNQSEAVDQQSTRISVHLVLELNWLITNRMEDLRTWVWHKIRIPQFHQNDGWSLAQEVYESSASAWGSCPWTTSAARVPSGLSRSVSYVTRRNENRGIRMGKSVRFTMPPDARSRLGGKDHLLTSGRNLKIWTSQWALLIWMKFSTINILQSHQGLFENGLYRLYLANQNESSNVQWVKHGKIMVNDGESLVNQYQPPNFSIFLNVHHVFFTFHPMAFQHTSTQPGPNRGTSGTSPSSASMSPLFTSWSITCQESPLGLPWLSSIATI